MQITGTMDAKTRSRKDATLRRLIGAMENELRSFLEDAILRVLRLHKFAKQISVASLVPPFAPLRLCAVAFPEMLFHNILIRHF